VPVVLVSSVEPAILAKRASDGGADAFLSTSANYDEFLGFVRNICAMTYSPEELP
jgi:hypothetical protein